MNTPVNEDRKSVGDGRLDGSNLLARSSTTSNRACSRAFAILAEHFRIRLAQADGGRLCWFSTSKRRGRLDCSGEEVKHRRIGQSPHFIPNSPN
jgi:hypothetical protein